MELLYIILAASVVFALFFILNESEDIDDSHYNRNENVAWKNSRKGASPKPQPKLQPKVNNPSSVSSSSMNSWKRTGSSSARSSFYNPTVPPPAETTPKAETKASEWKFPDISIGGEEELNLPPGWAFLSGLTYDKNLESDSMETTISGLRYHCTYDDLGTIRGYIKPEPSNQHDPRARAIIRHDGKLLGYLPRTDIDLYEDFNPENKVCPFTGKISFNAKGWLVAKIKTTLPKSMEAVLDEIGDYEGQ